MKKIPTLFERTFQNHKVSGITEKVTPGMEWVLDGEGVATVKIDGSCTAVINGRLLWEAFQNADTAHFGDGTYEAIGPHFQGNPYKLEADTLEKHGARTIDGLDRFALTRRNKSSSPRCRKPF